MVENRYPAYNENSFNLDIILICCNFSNKIESRKKKEEEYEQEIILALLQPKGAYFI